MCHLRPETTSKAGFLLLYYDDEILKPTNTGKLIADLFPDTYGFIWSRTEAEPKLLRLLQNPVWQSYVVFPSEYVFDDRPVFENRITVPEGKRPLFILLDGSWREAKKMFRKSAYLSNLPVLSISVGQLSDYQVRKATRDHQLATAEVASFALKAFGELHNQRLLQTWFSVFTYRYQMGVKQSNRGDPSAEQDLARLVAENSA